MERTGGFFIGGMMDWVPLNLSDTRAALQRFTSMEERGQWVCGYHQGATGGILMGGETDAFACGFASGAEAHANSSEHRKKVSQVRREAAEKRWNRNSPTNADAIACGKADPQDKTDITEQRTTEQHTPTPQRWERARFSPVIFDSLIHPSLQTTEFVECWHDWMSDRHDRKKPLTERAAREQLAMLSGLGVTSAMDCIRRSIANSWQGLFPQEQKQGSKPPPNKPKWNGFGPDYYGDPNNVVIKL